MQPLDKAQDSPGNSGSTEGKPCGSAGFPTSFVCCDKAVEVGGKGRSQKHLPLIHQ